MEDKISQINKSYQAKIEMASDLTSLDKLYLELFGKSGVLTILPKEFPNLKKDELRIVAPLFNKIKSSLAEGIEKRRGEIREKSYQGLLEEKLELQDVEIKERQGHIHPLDKFEQEIVDLFAKIGFQLFSAPHIDTDYYNFEVLNIPQEHPARDLWDTLYIDSKFPLRQRSEASKIQNSKLLLRTHTSNSQIRIMREFKPPIRIMLMDRCFRYENLDARHEHTFDQFELVFVDKGLSMANLQYLSEYFLKSVLGREIEVRMRPKYYPFVEPGVGIDGTCIFCKGRGCKVCGGIGWLELGGAGMIHPQVLKNGGIDPEVYSGIAWGPGLERILMLKHGIQDLRVFRSGDLKFLEKF